MQREDPFLSLSFEISIDKIKVANFSEVSGLGGEIELEEIKEGGVNEYIHKLPKTTKYNNLVLKKGMTDSNVLYKWFEKIANGEILLKEVNVSLKDSLGVVKKTWSFRDAFPVKLSATDLNSQTSTIMIETMELAHKGLF